MPPIKRKLFSRKLAKSKEGQAVLRKMAAEIRMLRQKYEYTQGDLAQRAGCTRSMIHHIESELNFPSIPLYRAICRELGQPVPPLT